MSRIPLLITAAMAGELKQLKNKICGCQLLEKQLKYYIADQPNSRFIVYLLETGVGKINATLKTATAINEIRPKLILHIGCCGALNDNIKIGTIICPELIKEHDCKFITADNTYNVELQKPIRISNTEILTKYGLADIFNAGCAENCIQSGMLSGDSVLLNSGYRDFLYNIHQKIYQAVDMESFATAAAAEFYEIDFLVLKIVVDNCRLNNSIKSEEIELTKYYPLKKIAAEFYNKQFSSEQFDSLMAMLSEIIIKLTNLRV